MRRFFENRLAFGATVLAFGMAAGFNASNGIDLFGSSHCMFAPEGFLVASGPTIPPDPWEGRSELASGPTIPPDPWEGRTITTPFTPTFV
jgi:hypothetical protein